MAFSRWYMAGQVASNPLSTAPNLNASSTDPVALFTKSIVESKEKVAHLGARNSRKVFHWNIGHFHYFLSEMYNSKY
jgi:hypothetical protein